VRAFSDNLKTFISMMLALEAFLFFREALPRELLIIIIMMMMMRTKEVNEIYFYLASITGESVRR
jgi:hypothetical protein